MPLPEDGGHAALCRLEGGVNGGLGILVKGALARILAHNDPAIAQENGDLHHVVIPLAVPVMGNVDHHATPFDAIAVSRQCRGILPNGFFDAA